MAQFSIGQFQFINLDQPPERSKLRTEREVRPGVAGATLWGMGRQPAVFQLASVVDVEDAAAGSLTLEAYEAIVGTQGFEVYWASVSKGIYFVHDVVPIKNGVHQTLLGIG